LAEWKIKKLIYLFNELSIEFESERIDEGGEQKEKSDGQGKGTYMGNGRANKVDKERVRPHWIEGSSWLAVHKPTDAMSHELDSTSSPSPDGAKSPLLLRQPPHSPPLPSPPISSLTLCSFAPSEAMISTGFVHP
jgi:hypothetical protein